MARINSDHIRYGKTVQLGPLMDVTPEQVTRWTLAPNFNMTVETAKSIAQKLGISYTELLLGFEHRRADAATAARFQAELDQLMSQPGVAV